jgi:single-stranded DNA-binding protein
VELRPLSSGTEVARLRVASGTRRRDGEPWVERTNYFTVEVYGPQANLCAERLGEGSRVVVDGEVREAGMDRSGAEPARCARAQGSSDPLRTYRFDPAGRE